MTIVLVLVLSIVMTISIFWVNAIDNMNEKHPDYKGEDLFDDNL